MRDTHAIMREDAKRRNARQLIEDAILSQSSEPSVDRDEWYLTRAGTRATGMTTPPSKYPHAKPRTRYSGTAAAVARNWGNAGTSPMMLVTYADGTQQIRPTHTRTRAKRAPAITTAAQVPETASLDHHHNYNN